MSSEQYTSYGGASSSAGEIHNLNNSDMSNQIQNIEENWTAIEQLEERAKEKYGDPEAGFNAGYFFFSGRRSLMIPIQYRKKKGNGFTEKRYEAMVVARYCPFTGRPLTNEIDLALDGD